jgi:hypothetical protein
MANEIAKRLMAAGASPQRAQQFALQFQKSVQAKSPGANLKPKDYNDAFDLALAEQSKELFPNAFRPPKSTDASFMDYAEFVLTPSALETIKTRSFQKNAPNFNTNLGKGTETIVGRIAENIKLGGSPAQILEAINTEKLNYDEDEVKEYDSLFFDVSKPLDVDKNVIKFVENLYNDYNKAQNAVITETESLLNDNRDYKYGIPDKKLTYGYSTNLKKGTIGVDTRPGVKEYFASENEKAKTQYPGASQAGGIAIDEVVKKLKGFTPNKDEQQRRFDIKYNR